MKTLSLTFLLNFCLHSWTLDFSDFQYDWYWLYETCFQRIFACCGRGLVQIFTPVDFCNFGDLRCLIDITRSFQRVSSNFPGKKTWGALSKLTIFCRNCRRSFHQWCSIHYVLLLFIFFFVFLRKSKTKVASSTTLFPLKYFSFYSDCKMEAGFDRSSRHRLVDFRN